MTPRTWALGTLLLILGCGKDETGDGGTQEIEVPEQPVAGGGEACGSVRLTEYWSAERGWCEFSRESSVLPEFVRSGMTFAIAEPYNGSSYQGEPGEACGECWEVDTINGTGIVMAYDLCPIEGNPLCAGGAFHFDLSPEAADVLGGGGLDAALARRVPCPVTGNIFAELLDRNEWGYVRMAFVNQRIPIRAAEYRAVDGTEWLPVSRSGGAFHVLDDGTTFADGSSGGVFRFTSPTGETVEGATVLSSEYAVGQLFDTGVNFEDTSATAPSCVFLPPGNVYDEGWGGIDQVRWAPNPWGSATASEVSEGCAEGSASCVLVSNLSQWDGFHLYYRQAFPTSTFSTLTLSLRALDGGGELSVAPSNDGEECEATLVEVGSEWQNVTIELTTVCAALSALNAVTVSNHADSMELLVDEVLYQ